MIIIKFDCPCPKKGCPNHGDCEVCINAHTNPKYPPFCQQEHGFFTKIFYKKSFEALQKLKAEGLI
ncbi:MAG: hypothetical protein ACFE96_13840 [Candidatus Hermodarchaeota archaeon]